MAQNNKWDLLNEDQQKKVKAALYGLFFNEVVSFSFVKKDGTLRPSFGCLDGQVLEENNAIPKKKEDSSESKPTPLGLFKYFDIEKKSWRSFNLNTLKEVYQVNFDDYIDKVLSQ